MACCFGAVSAIREDARHGPERPFQMASAFANDIEFRKLRARRDDVDLARLMLEFAADVYPDLDASVSLGELDRLGALAQQRLQTHAPAGAPLRDRLEQLGRLLYAHEKFRGNAADYYDPRNSYLNDVLGRRLGIPISLGVVYLTVARLADVPVYGVCAPGHFLLGCREHGQTLYVDPFSEGVVLERKDCADHLQRQAGQSGVVEDVYYQPASVFEIGARMLRNLKAAHVMRGQWASVLPVQHRLRLLLPDEPDEGRDLGLVLLRNGQCVPALAELEAYLRHCTADKADELKPYLRSARRMVCELN